MGFSYPRGNIESEFRKMKVFSGLQFEKGVAYFTIKNCVWACHFASGRKIPTIFLDKCKRMTYVNPQSPTMGRNDLTLGGFLSIQNFKNIKELNLPFSTDHISAVLRCYIFVT